MIERVVVINDRSEAIGGASYLAIMAARLLRERGLSVTFITGDAGNAPALSGEGVEVIGLGGTPIAMQGSTSAFLSGLYNVETVSRIRAWMSLHDGPSVIYHLHSWSKILSPSVFCALAPVRNRTILHAHDYFLVCPNGGFTNFRRDEVCSLRPMSASCLATHCDKRSYAQKLWRCARQGIRDAAFDIRDGSSDILLIHPSMAGFFHRSGVPQQRLHAVRNPIEPFSRRPVRPWKNRSFFFIGRLEPEKGFALAAEAARRANVPLEVIGDGAGRGFLEQRFPEVQIHGWKARDAIGGLVEKARAVVVSSRVPEPFSLVALEALTSGIPVVITDAALVAEEINRGGMGAIFRANDVDACARALRRLAVDDDAVADMSRRALANGRLLAHTPASWCDALVSHYEAALDRPSDRHVASRQAAK